MPYGKLKTQEVQRKVREGLRLTKTDNCPEEYFATASSCWKIDRHARPTFKVRSSSLQIHKAQPRLGIFPPPFSTHAFQSAHSPSLMLFLLPAPQSLAQELKTYLRTNSSGTVRDVGAELKSRK